LKLYTDNEKSTIGTWNPLRAQSSSFILSSGDSNLLFGHSNGSGIGINAFITDLGISTYNSSGTNIVSSSTTPNLLAKQTTVDNFFETLRHKFWNSSESYSADKFKLWQYIDNGIYLFNKPERLVNTLRRISPSKQSIISFYDHYILRNSCLILY
jgi:hypothetical protein